MHSCEENTNGRKLIFSCFKEKKSSKLWQFLKQNLTSQAQTQDINKINDTNSHCSNYYWIYIINVKTINEVGI